MKLFKSCLIAISISIPSYCFSQNSIDNNQIGGIRIGMGITEMKKIYPTYKFELFEPDGNGVGDWRMMESNVSTLDIYKPNTKTNSFSIMLDKKKVSVIDCQDKNYKTKESIAVGASLGDLMKVYPDLEISIIGSFDKITQREGVVITAMTKAYYNIQFQIASTAELDKMDADKIDKAKLPNNLKVHKITLLSTEAAKSQWVAIQSSNNSVNNSDDKKNSVVENGNTLSSILLYDGAISIKIGDTILINNPSIKPLADVWRFQYVYTEFWPDMPERSGTLRGRINLSSIIKALKYGKDGKTLYALVGFTNNGKYYELTIDVKKAITSHEIELANQSIIDKFVLFKAYLKSLKSINDNVVVGYINNFEPAKGDLNEFEKRRIIQNAKTKLDSIAGSDLRTTDLKYLSKLQFQEYDFSSHSFKTKGIGNSINFDFDSNIDGSSNIINLQFNNVGEELNIPINEAEAEKITSSYFKNGERTVYCIYNFDLANTTSGTVKAGAARLFGLSNALVQKSTVTSISFFGDADYANKIAEYKFNKTTEPKNDKIADRHATFPGGEKAMNDYVRTKLLYPKEANEKNIQGTVFIKFFVDTDGSIVNPSALTHLGGGLEELGIRIVKGMPNWLPAIKDGKPIKEELNIPFKFSRE